MPLRVTWHGSVESPEDRLNQYLRLLKLPPKIQEEVIKMGDNLPSRKITERRL